MVVVVAVMEVGMVVAGVTEEEEVGMVVVEEGGIVGTDGTADGVDGVDGVQVDIGPMVMVTRGIQCITRHHPHPQLLFMDHAIVH